jgi:hypothetical protein
MPTAYLDDLVLLVLPALALIFSWWHHTRASRGMLPSFRQLPGIVAFTRRMDEVVETGRPVHVATGGSESGAIGPTAASLASLVIAQRIGEEVTRRGGTVITTVGDITALAAARGSLRQAYRGTGLAGDYRSSNVQLVAHQSPIAYAAGVTRRYDTEPIDSSVVVGDYGAEALLIGEEGAARHVPQLSGATSLSALPALTLSTGATLVGEELFAAEAYLTSSTLPQARLLTQDALRRVVVLLLVIGVLYQILGAMLGFNLPAL